MVILYVAGSLVDVNLRNIMVTFYVLSLEIIEIHQNSKGKHKELDK